MLVQFMLKNVLSFREETILDMTAINAYKEHMCNLIDIGIKEKFIRVAAIYGANASGKSNLHFAMNCFKNLVYESFNNVSDKKDIAIKRFFMPFSFDGNTENSEFQIVLILDNFEYTYGFEYNSEFIEEEWLYRKDLENNRTSTIFERKRETIKLGNSIRKECEIYINQIPTETLVLSFFNKLKLETNVFKEVYLGITDFFIIPSDFCEDRGILESFLPEVIDEDKKNLLNFLSAIDVGIKDIRYIKNENKVEFRTTHIDRNENKYELDLFMESEGTIKSIMLFMYAKAVISENSLIFIDEINTKLHPLLLKFIIDLFYDEYSKAQLIYTTHDTTLMDKKFFRRDQIWFVQKDEFGYSELSSLSDFKVRSDASFEKDYLAGVYGGIPLLKEFTLQEGE